MAESPMSPKRVKRLSFQRSPIPLRRGVAILPSLFTVGNMFFGYYAIVLASKHNFEWAVTMVILAGVLDGLDGRIARMTGTTSEFGKELDSLSDFLSFGIAPALVLYHWGFSELGKTGWFFAFLLPVAGALRLARFNVQAGTVDKRWFVGLPIPAAAAAAVLPLYYLPSGVADVKNKVVALSYLPAWLTDVQKVEVLHYVPVACLIYVVALSWLMVSTVRFWSFKDLDMKTRRPSALVFFLAVLVIVIALNPPAVLLAIAVTYALSGPVMWLWGKVFKKKAGSEPVPPAADAGEKPAQEVEHGEC
jgi:CDP-diacylglycerol---serine O-phosphatidyltransferase